MEKELQEDIMNRFPEMFKHKENLMTSLMGFGIETNDGWCELIYNLCEEIEEYFLSQEENVIPEWFYITQIKEKFGSLRFYVSSAPMEIYDLINKAEEESFTICEVCGRQGQYRDDLSWILTLCDSCLDKHIEKRYGRTRKPDEDYISDWQKEQGAPFING